MANRAYLKEPATLVITNVTRSDTAQYRCEVTAHMDQRTFDEVLIDLVVRGMFVLCALELLNYLLMLVLIFSSIFKSIEPLRRLW